MKAIVHLEVDQELAKALGMKIPAKGELKSLRMTEEFPHDGSVSTIWHRAQRDGMRVKREMKDSVREVLIPPARIRFIEATKERKVTVDDTQEPSEQGTADPAGDAAGSGDDGGGDAKAGPQGPEGLPGDAKGGGSED